MKQKKRKKVNIITQEERGVFIDFTSCPKFIYYYNNNKIKLICNNPWFMMIAETNLQYFQVTMPNLRKFFLRKELK